VVSEPAQFDALVRLDLDDNAARHGGVPGGGLAGQASDDAGGLLRFANRMQLAGQRDVNGGWNGY
jgi:hypothetical protein